ncbi:MAG: aminoglycoside phosphotransferase, partial [Pseudomonadota bacterium]|nr:aminoglycoside phosphotransferase [Pseudomonadota bacterium]
DLVSLFEDARRDVSAELATTLTARYLEAFPEIDRQAFGRSYAVLGAQRSAKIIGVFTRLDRRDGKPVYLKHIPRVFYWLEGNLAHPVLKELQAWFTAEIPPAKRVIPESANQ